MKKRIYLKGVQYKIAALFLGLNILLSCGQQPNVSQSINTPAPHLKRIDNRTQLIVNGEPFLSLAGELHNSSSSSLEYMEKLWPILQDLHMNTVLAPVSWELIEPVEGKYDFSLIDGLITQARKNDMKLVFLWFGSWKNLVSTYAPDWVKKDPQRFPLFYNKQGERYQMLSALGEESWKADSKAYAALMKHIGEVDAIEQTVIMMQVQNEVGTNFGDRDYSELAIKAFEGEVPERLMSYLQKNKSNLIPEFEQLWANNGYKIKGTWKEVFGEGAPCNEIFMSWNLANYIGKVIEAGKAEYNIPMFVNAAIGRNTLKSASYPSGGPVPFVMDVWRAAAPELDMLTPDIYYGDFNKICEQYTLSGNPLYIPETRGGIMGAANAMRTFANFNGLGFSPFGIERYLLNDNPENAVFAKTYEILNDLSPLILSKESKKQMIATILDTITDNSVVLGKYKVDFIRRGNDVGFAMLIEIKPDDYIVVGHNISIEFSLNDRKNDEVIGFSLAEEGIYKNNNWIPERRMNGDQIMFSYSFSESYKKGKSGNGLTFRQLSVQRVGLYSY